MDIEDMSHNAVFAQMLQMARIAAENSRQRQGQQVVDHPTRHHVISAFMESLFMQELRRHERSTDPKPRVAVSLIPAPYAPCERPLDELTSMVITEMTLETHHRDRWVILRVCTPPKRMTAVMAVVEDTQGTATMLQLYYQPEEDIVPAQQLVQKGNVCILKEPYLKCTMDGSYSLRVDHLGDIIWLDTDDPRIPGEWREPGSTSISASRLRAQGNDAVRKGNMAQGLSLYSKAIKAATEPEERRLAYLNRSLTHLKLGRPEKALSDSLQFKDPPQPTEEKRLFREARALYELEDFELCEEVSRRFVQLFPTNGAGKENFERVTARVREQQTGEYDFRRMYKQAEATPPLIDCATFSSPVQVRHSPGRGGFGLFTTRAVREGELLLCEKAFAYSFGNDSKRYKILMNMGTSRVTAGGQASLIARVVQKLYHNPRFLESFRQLHHGNYNAGTVLEVDGMPVVDSFLVEKIIPLNSFGAPRTQLEFLSKRMKETTETLGHQATPFIACGVWLLAARINHSCVGNCRRSFIGDMQIVRATQRLSADTELLFPYIYPRPSETYDMVQRGLGRWGFSCDCELCRDRQSTSRALLRNRLSLVSDFDATMKSIRGVDVPRAQRIIEALTKTYRKPESHVCMELWNLCLSLGGHLLSIGRPAECIQMIVKGLEALGFRIIARPPMDSGDDVRLTVVVWGLASEHTTWACVKLFEAYQMVAPELCASAKRFAELAYSMAVGEKDTICDTFPQLG